MMRHLIWIAAIAAACGGGGKKGGSTTGDGTGDGTGGDGTGGGPAEVERAVGHPKDDLIPREILFGNPERANVQISPDGKHLSWLAPKDGLLNVWVAPVGDLAAARPVTSDTTRPVHQYFWALDKKHLLYLQDKGGDENFHLHRVVVETGEVTDLTAVEGARTEVIGLSPKKPGKIVVGLNDRNPQLFDLYTIDLASGERKLLMENPGLISWHLDQDLEVRFGDTFAPDGAQLLMQYDKKNKKKPWKEFDKLSGEDQFTSGFVAVDGKGTSYYALDSRGRNTGALVSVNIKTKKKKVLLEDELVDVGQPLLHPTTRALQAVQLDYDKPRWVALDKKVGADLDAIAKLDKGFPQIVSRTLDDQTWIVELNSDVQAPRYYRYDRKAKQGTFLFSVQPALDEQPLVPMHPVVIPSRDGLDLVSYLTLPASADPDGDGKADQPVPMVLFVHGGPWARDEWGYNPVHQVFANRGYAVLSVNYRGSLGFGKKFVNAADREWGGKMHDDLVDAVGWAVDQKIAPADKICIAGGSYGGFATLAGVTLTPELFACGVDLVGPSSLITFMETIPPYWMPFMSLLVQRVGDPSTEEGRQSLIERSPLTHAGEIVRPLLIVQGANDPRVKQSESDQIVKVMQEKKIPVSYVVYPDEGHGFAHPANWISFVALTEAFLSVHIGGWYQPITKAELQASSMQIEVGEAWLPGLPSK